jgi:hypothetical protein
LSNGLLAYVGKSGAGFQPADAAGKQAGSLPHTEYKPFCFNQALMTGDVEFSEEMFLITRETAEAYLKTKTAPAAPPSEAKPGEPAEKPKSQAQEGEVKEGPSQKKPEQLTFASLAWTGEVPPQKWMNFYTKVLSKFATTKGLKLKLSVEVAPEGGVSKQKLEETKAALRELGLSDNLTSM